MKLLGLLFLLCCPVFGQTTAVTFTVTDSDSQTWNNGQFIVTFVPVPGNPGPYVYNGSPMTAAQKGPYRGTMNGSGTGTVNLPDNHFIVPSGTKWQFVLAPNASAPSSTVVSAVTGASQNLSSTFSAAVIAPRFPALGSSSWGYLDGEVTPIPNPGGAYFNVTNKVVRVWDGTQWINGSGSSGGLIITPTGVLPAPSPLATLACPTGQGVWEYIQKADGTYQDTASLDVTTVNPPVSPAGTINHCWRTWWNDTGLPMPGMKRFLGVLHNAGNGGVSSNAGAFDESAIGIATINTGTEQTFRQWLTMYLENDLSGTPTFTGHAGGEDYAATIRANFTDTTTGGTAHTSEAIHGITFLDSTTIPNIGLMAVGVHGSVYDLLGGARASSGYEAMRADGSNSGGCTACDWTGLHVVVPSAKFTVNQGIFIDNFGNAGANDFDLAMNGVNSAGTPAGFWYGVGPLTLGNAAKASANYQFDVTGAVKIKAGVGVRQLDLFGSTSGSCGISTDATSTTETHTCPLSAPGLGTVTNVTGTSPIVSSGGATPAISCPTCLRTSTAPVGVQAASTTLLGGDVAVAATTSTTVLSHAVTMPSSGCPCRVFAAYNFYALSGAGLTSTGWITDGTIEFGTTMTTASGGGVNYPYTGSSFSTSTYSNSASVTFTFKVFSSDATTIKRVSPVATPTQDSYLNLVVFTSN